MLLVDDRVAVVALSGHRFPGWEDRTPTITWLFHYRLLRALMYSSVEGQLSRDVTAEAIRVAQDPPASLLTVHDPRPHTAAIVTTAHNARLSAAAAEFVTVAIRNTATIRMAERNVGANWRSALADSGVVIHAYSPEELAAGQGRAAARRGARPGIG